MMLLALRIHAAGLAIFVKQNKIAYYLSLIEPMVSLEYFSC